MKMVRIFIARFFVCLVLRLVDYQNLYSVAILYLNKYLQLEQLKTDSVSVLFSLLLENY